MGLGEKGKKRMAGAPKVDDLFRPTVKDGPVEQSLVQEDNAKKIGRPKGEATKAKTFSLPLELNQRLRRYAFECECSEVDVVRAALEEYLDRAEKRLATSR